MRAGWHWNEITSNPQSPVGLPVGHHRPLSAARQPKSFGPNVGSILNQWTYSFKDVATKIVGPHTIKFGGEVTQALLSARLRRLRRAELQLLQPVGLPQRCAAQRRRCSFNPNTGFPTTVRQDDRETSGDSLPRMTYKLRRNLTLNLGLRWSYFSPLSSKENNMFVAHSRRWLGLPDRTDRSQGKSRWNAQKDNFGPQIGFAWSPGRFHDKLVVRGGYGLNYNQEEIAISANIMQQSRAGGVSELECFMSVRRNPRRTLASSTRFPRVQHSLAHRLSAEPDHEDYFDSFGLPMDCLPVGLVRQLSASTSFPAPCPPCVLITTLSIRSTIWVTSLLRPWDIREACRVTSSSTRTRTPRPRPWATR